VTVRHKTGKEAQPCAPARCWAYCFCPARRGQERQGKTNHLVGKEARREFKKRQGIGSK
jgi:hypothetical protein